MYDVAIIGGGIVGLATGMALGQRYPHARIVVLEKECGWAHHQTGHNSGVIHSGIYYKPGSFKAQFARAGNQWMVAFCQAHGIRHDVCGKVIVATARAQLPLLESLHQRGLANGLAVTLISAAELHEIEPHVAGLAAIRVPCAAIVDYKQVAAAFVQQIEQHNGDLLLNAKVEHLDVTRDGVALHTAHQTVQARFVINCAGLHSDRVAQLARAQTGMKIVPFRGEYYELKPTKRYLVKHLIYPVPNPAFPFLGVHFTRMINGDVHAGPNAVLSLKREGYRKRDVSLHDALDVLCYPAFWMLARRHAREGAKEIVRSLSKAAFVRSLQQLIPAVQADDIVPSHAGVRAQALMRDGKLMDDFVIIGGERSIHVCNAPSPAATASIPIGNAIVDQFAARYGASASSLR